MRTAARRLEVVRQQVESLGGPAPALVPGQAGSGRWAEPDSPWVDLAVARLMTASGSAVAATEGLLQSVQHDATAQAHVMARLLDALFSPEGAVRCATTPGLVAVAAAIIDHPAGAAACAPDYLSSAARSVNALQFPREIAQCVLGFQKARARGEDGSVATRMRRGQALTSHYRALMGNTPRETLLATLTAAADLPLNRQNLHVIAAHVAPIVRCAQADASSALAAVANLRRWQGELLPLERQFVAQHQQLARRPVLPPEATPQTFEASYSEALAAELRATVERAHNGEGLTVPDVVVFERAFGELGVLLCGLAVRSWHNHAPVSVALLQMLAGIRHVRPFALGILDATLTHPDSGRHTDIEAAAVGFAISFLTGMTAQAAWHSVGVVETDTDEALREVQGLLEVDAQVRQRLISICADPTRAAATRSVAFEALLTCAPQDQARADLLQHVTTADLPLMRGFLRYVVRFQSSASAPVLWTLHENRAALAAADLDALYAAIAASRSHEAPYRLEAELLAGDGRAQRTLAAMGHDLALQRVENTLQAHRNLEEDARLTPERSDALRRSTAAYAESARHAVTADRHTAAASHVGTVSRIGATEEMMRGVDLRLRALPVEDEIADHIRSSGQIRERLNPVLANLDGLRHASRNLRGEMEVCAEAIRNAQQRERSLQGDIASWGREMQQAQGRLSTLQQENRRLQGRLRDTQNDVAQASRRAASVGSGPEHAAERGAAESAHNRAKQSVRDVERQLQSNERDSTEQDRSIDRLQRKIDDGRAELSELARRLRQLEGELTKHQRAIEGLESRRQRLQSLANGFWEEIRALQRAIAQCREQLSELIREGEHGRAAYESAQSSRDRDLERHLAGVQSGVTASEAALGLAEVAQADAMRITARQIHLQQDTTTRLERNVANREAEAAEIRDAAAAAQIAEQAMERHVQGTHRDELRRDVLLLLLGEQTGGLRQIEHVRQRLEDP